MNFKPENHWTHPVRSFNEFKIGEIFRAPSRTMTEGVFASFQSASGDNHPIHYDRNYLKSRGHPDLYSHGFQTLIQAAIGATPLAHQMGDALIGFIEQSSRFLAPVYCGDTLYPTFRIANMIAGRTTGVMELSVTIHKQDGTLVVEGMQRYLLNL